jgi:hypothetical protein
LSSREEEADEKSSQSKCVKKNFILIRMSSNLRSSRKANLFVLINRFRAFPLLELDKRNWLHFCSLRRAAYDKSSLRKKRHSRVIVFVINFPLFYYRTRPQKVDSRNFSVSFLPLSSLFVLARDRGEAKRHKSLFSEDSRANKLQHNHEFDSGIDGRGDSFDKCNKLDFLLSKADAENNDNVNKHMRASRLAAGE